MKSVFGRLSTYHHRLRWYATLCWSTFETVTLLAIAAVVLCVGLWGIVIWPLRHDVTQLTRINAQLARHPLKTGEARASARLNLSQAFIAFLPPLEAREQQLLQLHNLFSRYALTISRIDYQYQTLSALPVERMSLRLSLQGGYVAQRKMLHDLLAMLPNLAVDKLSLEKVIEKSDTLSQRMELSLYYQSPSAASRQR